VRRLPRQVPKVTRQKLVLFPFSRGPDQAIGDYTQPEIHHQTPVQVERMMAGQMKRGTKKKVSEVAENNGEKSFDQVHSN
jgi:hypothetical protein